MRSRIGEGKLDGKVHACIQGRSPAISGLQTVSKRRKHVQLLQLHHFLMTKLLAALRKVVALLPEVAALRKVLALLTEVAAQV